MKIILLIYFLFAPILVFPQQASDYFPSATGYLWNYQITPLDSLNNPMNNLIVFRQDSFVTVQTYQGREAKIVLSKEGPSQSILLQPYTDSIFYSFQETDGYEYFSVSGIESFLNQLDSIGIDSNFNFLEFFSSLQGWYPVYRFGASPGVRYTLLQKDTTISTYNIRFKYSAVRNNDETINTNIGTFNCKKFITQWEFSYLLGPIPIPLFAINDTIWIASGNWIVKAFQPSIPVDLSLLGIPPFFIPGRTIDIIDQIVGVNDQFISLDDFKLYQNYPNPFNPSTKIIYSIPANYPGQNTVTLKVYDILGNEITTLVDEIKEPGNYEVEFNASGISSGIYFYQLQAGNIILTRKMSLLR